MVFTYWALAHYSPCNTGDDPSIDDMFLGDWWALQVQGWDMCGWRPDGHVLDVLY